MNASEHILNPCTYEKGYLKCVLLRMCQDKINVVMTTKPDG